MNTQLILLPLKSPQKLLKVIPPDLESRVRGAMGQPEPGRLRTGGARYPRRRGGQL